MYFFLFQYWKIVWNTVTPKLQTLVLSSQKPLIFARKFQELFSRCHNISIFTSSNFILEPNLLKFQINFAPTRSAVVIDRDAFYKCYQIDLNAQRF